MKQPYFMKNALILNEQTGSFEYYFNTKASV